jgi:Dolichyl-phosphate-mannose-protein mannosyltransferase
VLSAPHIAILSAMEDALSGAAAREPASQSAAAPAEPPASGPRGAHWLDDLSESPLSILILLGVGTLLFFVNLGGYPLYTKGEPREAVVISDMVRGGGVILPLRDGVEIPSKPPLMHWLAALLSLIAGGVSEWTVRMPSALFAIGGMLVCYFYMRRLFNDRAAFLAALVLGTTAQYLQAGTGARVDMALTFFMEVGFFEFLMIAEGLTKRRMTLYLVLAAAVLAKGPVGVLLPGLVALVWMAVARRWDVIRKMRIWRGAALVAVIAGGWYVAATIVGGMPFVHKQIFAENLFRFFHDSAFHEGHAHPFFYMEGALLVGFMPWALMLPLVMLQAARHPRPRDQRLTYLLVWFATVLVFYNLPQSKRGVYLLALYPALAGLLGIYLDEIARAPRFVARWVRGLRQIGAVAFIVTGVVAMAGLAILAFTPHTMLAIFKPFGITDYDFVPQLELAAAAHPFIAMALCVALFGIGVFLAREENSVERLGASVVGAVVCIALAANLVVLPALANTLTLKPFTREALHIVGHHTVGYMGALNYDVAFYSNRNMPIVSIWNGPRPDFLIAWRMDYMRLPPSIRSQLSAVLLSHPTELDGSGGMVLLRCEPSGSTAPGPPSTGGKPRQFSV